MFLPDSVRGTTPGGGLATVLGRENLALPFLSVDDLVSAVNVEGEAGVEAIFEEEACRGSRWKDTSEQVMRFFMATSSGRSSPALPLIPLLVSDPICCQSSLSALRTCK